MFRSFAADVFVDQIQISPMQNWQKIIIPKFLFREISLFI